MVEYCKSYSPSLPTSDLQDITAKGFWDSLVSSYWNGFSSEAGIYAKFVFFKEKDQILRFWDL